MSWLNLDHKVRKKSAKEIAFMGEERNFFRIAGGDNLKIFAI